MDIKKSLVFLLLILVLFISSCVPGPASATTSKGLNFKFIDGSLADNIGEDDEVRVGFDVQNSMTEPIDFQICIHGGVWSIYGGVPSTQCERLTVLAASEGSNSILIPGKVSVYFPDKEGAYYYYNLKKDLTQTSIKAELMYSIKNSESKSEICIVDDPDSKDIKENCGSAKETIPLNKINQDSFPVIVNRIEKTMSPSGGNNKIKLDIFLGKEPSGEIYGGDKNGYPIEMKVLLGLDQEFVCETDSFGRILFKEGKSIHCETTVERPLNPYVEGINIQLSYIYKLEDSKSITLENKMANDISGGGYS